MNTLKGHILEKIGQNVNKIMLLRVVGRDNKGNPQYVNVASHFFEAHEKFWKFGENTYELHPQNEAYLRQQSHVQFADFETGCPISMGGGATVAYSPKVLHRLMKVEHLSGLAKVVASPAGGYIIILAAVGVGVLIGVLVTPYLPLPGGAPPSAPVGA